MTPILPPSHFTTAPSLAAPGHTSFSSPILQRWHHEKKQLMHDIQLSYQQTLHLQDTTLSQDRELSAQLKKYSKQIKTLKKTIVQYEGSILSVTSSRREIADEIEELSRGIDHAMDAMEEQVGYIRSVIIMTISLFFLLCHTDMINCMCSNI